MKEIQEMKEMQEKKTMDSLFFSSEERKLIGDVFGCEQGAKLLKLWQFRHLNTSIANPHESANMAFFKEGQQNILKNIAASYDYCFKNVPDEIKS